MEDAAEHNERSTGKIVTWKRIRNFGFIHARGVSRHVFLHANDIKQRGYVPKAGETVHFHLVSGSDGKPKALDASFPAARPAQMAQSAYHGSLVLLQLVLLVGVLTGTFFLLPRLFVPLLSYLAMSAITFLVYYLDKRKAIARKRRVPEMAIHIFEMFGGWPGGLLARGILRHKTSKRNFLVVCWFIVAAHVASWTLIATTGLLDDVLRVLPGN